MRYSGNIVDIENREIFKGELIVENGRIAEINKTDAADDVYIIPPFIDAHVHVESSMLVPSEFARIASTHGTGVCVSDPHEIANVLGMRGVKFMAENAENLPFYFFFGAPSCVPATPFETAGGKITADDIEELFRGESASYLSEMMNIPGVLNEDKSVSAKLALARKYKKRIDGHAPMLRGRDLKKYIDAGISADHEAVSFDEGLEKINNGMRIQIREGSAAKNFSELAPLMRDYPEMCMLCSDDLHPDNLVKGHINLLVKRAVAEGIDVFNVLYSACITPVKHYGLNTGILRKGGSADFVITDNLNDFNIIKTVIKGDTVSEYGEAQIKPKKVIPLNIFNAKSTSPADFRIKDTGTAEVITVQDGQLVTGRMSAQLTGEDGYLNADTERDILKIAVINRYENKPVSCGFVHNFGLKRGAFASSVAHDSHNIIAVGADDVSLSRAVNLIVESQGGLSVADGAYEDVLPLPVAGLMTDRNGFETAEKYLRLQERVKNLGSALTAPYMSLSFMALLVIPELKISDKGMFDGVNFRFITENA